MAYQWVTSLYFFQSLPFVVVNVIATLMYQSYGMGNAQSLFLSSLLTLPWVLKPFFAPFLEKFSSKKHLTLVTQLAISLIFLLLAILAEQSKFLSFSVFAFACLALFSSMHDIVSDGLYIQNLDISGQKRYIPLRSLFYQLGRFITKGALLIFVANLALHTQLDPWQLFFYCLFTLALILTIYHYYKLPDARQKADQPHENYLNIFKTLLFDQGMISPMLFLFFYNMTDAQMQKMIPLYLLDKDGLNLSLSVVGNTFGVIGSFALMFGIFIAGQLLNQYSLKSCLRWLTLNIFVGPLLFLMLQDSHSILLYPTIILTQVGSGMANAAFMAYMLSLANHSPYPMSAYTLFTAIMALSYLFFAIVSGFIQQSLGYSYFFLYLLVTSIIIFMMTLRMVRKGV